MKISQRFDNFKLDYAARSFSVICHPQRNLILQLIEEYGELTVTQIYEKLNFKQAETSDHLARLRTYKIVNKVRRGKCSIYSLNKPLLEKVIEYAEVLGKFNNFVDVVIENPPKYFRKKKKKMNWDEFKLKYPKAASYMAELREKRTKK